MYAPKRHASQPPWRVCEVADAARYPSFSIGGSLGRECA